MINTKSKKWKMINAKCQICGNYSGYDEQSLKASTWNINGCKIVLCCFCEDDLFIKIAKGRGVNIELDDGGEINQTKSDIITPIYYIKPLPKSKRIIDAEAMLMEFQEKLSKIIRKNKNV